jgi:hypothetical protein
MKLLFQLLMPLAFAVNSFAQPFSILYDHTGFANGGIAIAKFQNNFLTTHAALDLNIQGYSTLVAAYNENGIMFWDTTLSNITQEFSQTGLNTAILSTESDSQKWVVGNYSLYNNTACFPFLQKLNTDGTAEELITLDTLSFDNPRVFGAITNPTGIYLMCSNGNLLSANELLIVKCKLTGEYVWKQSYDIGFAFNPKCIHDVGDGFLIGGWRYANSADQTDSNGQQYVRKFNYEGQSQWINTIAFGDNINLGAVGFATLDNGNYLFSGHKCVDYPTYSIQPLIGELDASTGDTLWTRLYFDPYLGYDPNNLVNYNSQNRLHGFKKLEAGGYIGVGECRHDIIPDSAMGPLDNASFIMKLDNNFNLMWKRIYVPDGYAELDMSAALCRLNDFVENADGSITALGMVYMYTGIGPQGGYIQDSYMIRVDSLGCLIPGCSVGITEFEDLTNLLVYPNPTSSNLTIQLPNTGTWTIRLYNMSGQLISTEKISGNNLLDLNLQNFTSGLYTVQAMNNEGKVYTEVVVKE